MDAEFSLSSTGKGMCAQGECSLFRKGLRHCPACQKAKLGTLVAAGQIQLREGGGKGGELASHSSLRHKFGCLCV